MIAPDIPTDMNIVFTGLKHSGKTTHGFSLAKDTDRTFVDLDNLILCLHRQQSWISDTENVREIYRNEGKEVFQKYELIAAKAAVVQSSLIISCGGGIADNAPALELLQDTAFVVYLFDREETLFSRIMERGIPAFHSADNTEEEFHAIFVRRDRIYSSIANVKIDLSGMDITKAYSAIRRQLEEHFNGK